MILSYTLPKAEENILSGTKIHTMRSDKVNRWKEGREIHHATGNRTPEYNCFLKNKCTSTQAVLLVLIPETGEVKATIDRRRLTADEVHQLAINDGFNNLEELKQWFFKDDKSLWAGKLIHWTKMKY